MIRRIALAPLLLASACQSVVWHGRTADLRRRIEVVERRGRQHIEIDGRREAEQDGIGVDQIVFSDDGRHAAYPAERGGRWRVIVDGVEGPEFDTIGEILLSSAGTPTYSAERSKRWQVVHGDRTVGSTDAVMKGSITVSPDGAHVAWAGRSDEATFVMQEDRRGERYDAVGDLRFTSDGKHLFYIGRRAREAWVVRDEVATGPYEAVAEIAFSDDGGRIAWLARRNRRWFAVVDGKEEPPHDSTSAVRVTPSGRRVAYVARDDHRERLVLDGVAGPEFERIDGLHLQVSDEHVAFRSSRDGSWRVVVDDLEVGPFKEVSPPILSGGRWGYVAQIADHSTVVVSDEPPSYEAWAGDLVLPPAPRSHAYVARRNGRLHVVTERSSFPFDIVLRGTLDVDGPHWACVAGDRVQRQLFVVVDGAVRAQLRTYEITGPTLGSKEIDPLRGAEQRLRQWVRAQLRQR